MNTVIINSNPYILQHNLQIMKQQWKRNFPWDHETTNLSLIAWFQSHAAHVKKQHYWKEIKSYNFEIKRITHNSLARLHLFCQVLLKQSTRMGTPIKEGLPFNCLMKCFFGMFKHIFENSVALCGYVIGSRIVRFFFFGEGNCKYSCINFPILRHEMKVLIFFISL